MLALIPTLRHLYSAELLLTFSKENLVIDFSVDGLSWVRFLSLAKLSMVRGGITVGGRWGGAGDSLLWRILSARISSRKEVGGQCRWSKHAHYRPVGVLGQIVFLIS